MPAPVVPWTAGTWPDAKSLSLALYTCDGSADHPQGVAFHSARPILFENYTQTPTLHTSATGTQTALPTSGTTTGGTIIYDTAGYFGMTQDQPTAGYYQFLAAVKGSAGDGQTAGGWTLLSHFAAIAHGSTQTSVSADLNGTGQPSVAGTRQAPSSTLDSCPFFLDLVSTPGGPSGITWSPAVTIRDSGSANTTTVVSTDSSGEACRLLAVWAAVSATVSGIAVFDIGDAYPWTAPAGVSTAQAAATGAGGGGGAGNNSGGGIEYGGGGGGGGEFALGTINTTPNNDYTVNVGSGGTGGTTGPSTAGGAGGLSQIAGDSGTQVIAHGGSGGPAATTTANGSGAAGGTGSGAATHFNGGAGATGSTGNYGGGGGSSAGTGQAGTTAMGASGAPAPSGGGPGGAGGSVDIAVVQTKSGSATGGGTVGFALNFKNAVQAGNSVIVAFNYQGKPAAQGGQMNDPTITLSDGTAVSGKINADNSSISTYMQAGLYSFFAATGGQTGIVFTGAASTAQGDYRAVSIQMYEVTGLGPSPSPDAQESSTTGTGGTGHGGGDQSAYPPSGTTNPATNSAPEFWIGVAAGQQNTNFDVQPPGTSQGWTCLPETGASHGSNTIYSQMLSGYQVATTTTTGMKFSGSFSKKVSVGWIAASFSTSAVTTGTPPVTGPGGGGGGGLGAVNGGGAGFDGALTLTWTGISGSGYGTPALPAPFSGWSAATTIGTSYANGVQVDLNDSTGIAGVLNFLSSPPIVRVSTVAGQSIGSLTANPVQVTFGAATVDSYSGWNSGTSTYTIARDGLYLFHGLASFSANSTGVRLAGVTVNGTTYWGPPGNATASGTTNVAKTQVFSLKAGDTVQFAVWQNSGASLALDTTSQTRFFLVWLGLAGLPAASWTPPDTTFRWASGTPPTELPALFQQRLANDLGFLCNRPYLLAHQTVAQSGLTSGAFSPLVLDTLGGIVHTTDPGDSYSGWTSGASNKYTAPEPGWYLLVEEAFATAASATSATVTAGIAASSSGGATPAHAVDYYQANTATIGASIGGGAAAYGIQYMLAGESITPQLMGAGYSGSVGTLVGTAHGGSIASHLECIWLSL